MLRETTIPTKQNKKRVLSILHRNINHQYDGVFPSAILFLWAAISVYVEFYLFTFYKNWCLNCGVGEDS